MRWLAELINEHEPTIRPSATSAQPFLGLPFAPCAECSRRAVVDGHDPRPRPGLRGAGHDRLGNDACLDDLDDSGGEVDVTPAEAAELAAAQPGRQNETPKRIQPVVADGGEE